MSLHTTAPAALPTPTTPGGPVPGDAGPGGWRALGAVLTALLLILGTTGVASWLVRKTEAVDRTYQRTVSRVVVDSGSGDVTVAAGADGEIRLHERRFWSWSKPVDQVTWEGGTLRLSFRCPPVSLGPGCGVDYRLRVPAGVPVEVRTGAGDVTARDLAGPVTLTTGSGDLTVSRLSGGLALRTGSGDVTADGIGSARADARTGSGNVYLSFDAPPRAVTARAGSGDVTLVVPRGDRYRVAARTGSGGVAVRVDQDPRAPGVLTADSGSGDVTIGYP